MQVLFVAGHEEKSVYTSGHEKNSVAEAMRRSVHLRSARKKNSAAKAGPQTGQLRPVVSALGTAVTWKFATLRKIQTNTTDLQTDSEYLNKSGQWVKQLYQEAQVKFKMPENCAFFGKMCVTCSFVSNIEGVKGVKLK